MVELTPDALITELQRKRADLRRQLNSLKRKYNKLRNDDMCKLIQLELQKKTVVNLDNANKEKARLIKDIQKICNEADDDEMAYNIAVQIILGKIEQAVKNWTETEDIYE